MDTLAGIGTRLAAARRARGMSQRELGLLLGVRQQQVARWEITAYRNATLERVDAVATALGVQPAGGAGGAPVLAAESADTYGSRGVAAPVRDLGEIAARIRGDADVLAGEYGFGRIGVFGSFARGEQSPDSDVDLLIEIADFDKVRGLRYVGAANHVETLLGRPTDVTRPDLLKDGLRPGVMEDVVYVWSA